MGAAHHDRVLAIVSHLPHLIAFTICGTADDLADETREEVLEFAATGFRDFTRIAASDPVMWRDVFINNKDALLEMYSRFSEDAQAMARAVRWGDTDYIEDKIKRSRKIRKTLIDINKPEDKPMIVDMRTYSFTRQNGGMAEDLRGNALAPAAKISRQLPGLLHQHRGQAEQRGPSLGL
jgi:Prephenate dehydrogenase